MCEETLHEEWLQGVTAKNVAKVLKAKSYHNGRLEDTVFASNASSTWQAIHHGLELLKRGLVWRVGDGQQIRIWRDPWLPRPPSYSPISPRGDMQTAPGGGAADRAWRMEGGHHPAPFRACRCRGDPQDQIGAETHGGCPCVGYRSARDLLGAERVPPRPLPL